MTVVDSSAVIAILRQETDAETYLDAIDVRQRERPMALWLAMGKRLSPRDQRARRRERDEWAFLFDSELSLIAEFEREDWEWALSSCGGDPVRAARQCGLSDVPAGAKALWGRSADEARSTYRRWQRQR